MIPGRPVTRRASLSARVDRLRAGVQEHHRVERLRERRRELVRQAGDRLGEADRRDRADQPVDLGVDGRGHPRVGVAQRRDGDAVGEVEVGRAVGVDTADGPGRGSTRAGSSGPGRASGAGQGEAVVHAPECIGAGMATGSRRPASLACRHGRLQPDRENTPRPGRRARLRRGRDPAPHPRLGHGRRLSARDVRQDGRAGLPRARRSPSATAASGMDYIAFAILCEELERADTAFRVVQSVHVGLNSLALLQWGTEEQRQRWLVPQARGREARHVRADRARRRHGRRQPRHDRPPRRRRATGSTARRSGSAWPTSPTTSSSSPRVDRSQGPQGRDRVPARARDGRPDRPARSTASSASGPATPGSSTSTTCVVPDEHRIGEEGEGFLIAMSAIDQGRYTVAAGAVGLAQACLDASRPVRPRAPDVRPGDRPAPAGQAADRQDGRGHRDRAGCSSGGPAGSRTRACATPARRAWPSGTPPSTRPERARRDPGPRRQRLLATSSRSSATCATRRRPSSTRARASCTRSSRPTTRWATARTGRCAASRGRPRAGSARRPELAGRLARISRRGPPPRGSVGRRSRRPSAAGCAGSSPRPPDRSASSVVERVVGRTRQTTSVSAWTSAVRAARRRAGPTRRRSSRAPGSTAAVGRRPRQVDRHARPTALEQEQRVARRLAARARSVARRARPPLEARARPRPGPPGRQAARPGSWSAEGRPSRRRRIAASASRRVLDDLERARRGRRHRERTAAPERPSGRAGDRRGESAARRR